jgi:hypothetical protein
VGAGQILRAKRASFLCDLSEIPATTALKILYVDEPPTFKCRYWPQGIVKGPQLRATRRAMLSGSTFAAVASAARAAADPTIQGNDVDPGARHAKAFHRAGSSEAARIRSLNAFYRIAT